MALSDYQAERREFNLKGGSFHVEGVSLEVLAKLIKTNLGDLEELFNLTARTLGGKEDDITEGDLMNIAMVLAEEAPGFVASLISLASGEDSDKARAAVRKLPFPVQVEAVVAIGQLTFEETGGIKKSLEALGRLLNGLSNTTSQSK